jgi:hypothetical protein
MALFAQPAISYGLLSSSLKLGQPYYLLTISGTLVASNQINLTINGVGVTATNFTTSPANTMQLLAQNIAAHADVTEANYLGWDEGNNVYKIKFIGRYQNTLTITALAITGGATQPVPLNTYDGGISEVPFEGGGQPVQRLSQRSDSSTTANKVYHGLALANSAETDPVWYIWVVDSTVATEPDTLFPTTGAAFDYAWSNRASITYS